MGIPSSMCLFVLLSAMFVSKVAGGCDAGGLAECISGASKDDGGDELTEQKFVGRCKGAKSRLECLENLDVEACPDIVKESLRKTEKSFSVAVDVYCDENDPKGIFAFTKCRDARIMSECKQVTHRRLAQGMKDGTVSTHDFECGLTKSEMECTLEATVGCPPLARAGIKALRKLTNAHLELRNCSALSGALDDGNAGFSAGPHIFTILGAVCSTMLFSTLK